MEWSGGERFWLLVTNDGCEEFCVRVTRCNHLEELNRCFVVLFAFDDDNVMGTFRLPNIVRSLTHSNEKK